nr:hypothetical protein [Tanacetum cinerariifolium]
MIQPELEEPTPGYPLVSVEVLRYDKRSKSENMRIVSTEMKIILEQTQQDSHHMPSGAMHNPSQPLKVRKTLFQNSRRYTHFYRLSHSELVGIEKEELSFSLWSLN